MGFERYTETTRRAAFLAEMEQVVPRSALCALIEPFYPKPGNDRRHPLVDLDQRHNPSNANRDVFGPVITAHFTVDDTGLTKQSSRLSRRTEHVCVVSLLREEPMDANTPSFSTRGNAKRAAEAKLANGTAPAAEYELRTRDDARTEIVWKTTSTAPARIDEIRGGINGHDTTNPPPSLSRDPSDATSTAPSEPAVAADQPAGHAKPAEQSRPRAADGGPTRGVMPQKPVVTSKTNRHYQRRFDRLAELAAAGDWDAVRAYEIRGSNTYSKMLERYRNQLLATHDAPNTEQ